MRRFPKPWDSQLSAPGNFPGLAFVTPQKSVSFNLSIPENISSMAMFIFFSCLSLSWFRGNLPQILISTEAKNSTANCSLSKIMGLIKNSKKFSFGEKYVTAIQRTVWCIEQESGVAGYWNTLILK